MPGRQTDGMCMLIKAKLSVFSKILNMMERIKSMDLPTEAFIIMINIVGFASDGVTLDNQQFVEETQSHYMNLLYRSALLKTYFIPSPA